ncbi:MAG: transporter [Deltaproteobacteria bacterium]|nr:transporter [Deltaproteobacteria bacterium]
MENSNTGPGLFLATVLAITATLGAAPPAYSETFDNHPPRDDFAAALETDRPDISEASSTVGRHRFQLETSVAYSRDHDSGTTTHFYSAPTLLRFGISEPLEVRLESDMFAVQRESGMGTTHGLTDLAFGMKAHLTDGSGGIPSLGVLAHLGVPTGNDEFSANGVEPELKILADWDVVGDLALGMNVGADIPVRDAAGDKFARFLYSAAFSHPIPGLRDRWRVFVEAAGTVPAHADKPDTHIFNTGTALLITPNLQLDAFAAVGLTAAAEGIQTGLGISWRR